MEIYKNVLELRKWGHCEDLLFILDVFFSLPMRFISQVSLILLADMIILDLVNYRTPSSPIYLKITLSLSLHSFAS